MECVDNVLFIYKEYLGHSIDCLLLAIVESTKQTFRLCFGFGLGKSSNSGSFVNIFQENLRHSCSVNNLRTIRA